MAAECSALPPPLDGLQLLRRARGRPGRRARAFAIRSAGGKLVWSDEFDGTKVNETKWGVRYPGLREAGFISPDAVSMDGPAQLLLTIKEQDGKLLND